MTACPDTVKRLIDRFTHQADQLRSPDYNETQLRIDFVNPLFSELGWDVENKAGNAEQYREVFHEDRVKVAGQTKAPDYSFRIGGVRKFFLEAKKPFVNIKDAVEPAYQLRRYGWSAKLAVSLLTDFEELAVYDCRVAPKHLDQARTARREYINYQEYPARWDFFEGTFSKRAVLQGDFDRYCQTKKGRGRDEFDDKFLEEIEDWRQKLANNIALRNKIEAPALNFAVQRIIDRIIFLRIAEDRGTEPTAQLQALLNGDHVYDRLGKLFRNADARYNSGLFHFSPEKDRDEQPDILTPGLEIDDKALKDMIDRLYYPKSPYEFSVVSADILGSVYERFLGHVISLTPARRVKIEEKPEVRKAGGVYYTPAYIVNYIVKNTVGKLLGSSPSPGTSGEGPGEGITPKDAAKIKILDPACGSGSFLIGAYQFLLDWHINWYITDGPEKWSQGKNAALRPGQAGDWKLTIAERKRILLDNIHGVDIDASAVEVTKLNLLLKCLEGETSQTLGFQQRLFRERALPDLGHNILCGNSLVGTDIINSHAWKQMSDEEKRRINPFDYERAFPKVFKQGGFDAVIGNPPYLYSAFQDVGYDLAPRFEWVEYQTDIYAVFFEQAIHIAKPNGYAAMIVSDSWLKGEKFSKMRGAILTQYDLAEVATFDYPPFRDATIENSIIFCRKRKPWSESLSAARFSTPDQPPRCNAISKKIAVERGLVDVFSNQKAMAVINKIDRVGHRLSEFFDINRGIHAYRIDGYGRSRFCRGPQTKRDKEEQSYHAEGQLDATYMKEYKGKDVLRYRAAWAGKWLSYGDWLAEPREPKYFTGVRAAVRKVLGNRLSGTLFEGPAAIDQSLYIIVPKKRDANARFALGVLLSSLGAWYLRTKYSIYDSLYPWYTKKQLAAFPVSIGSDPRLDRLAGAMLDLSEKLAHERVPQRREALQREIDATDRQIDQLVYELYGLTEDEIRVVEEATR